MLFCCTSFTSLTAESIRRFLVGNGWIGDLEDVKVSELFTDDMSDFEKASAYVSSGLCHMSDGAVTNSAVDTP